MTKIFIGLVLFILSLFQSGSSKMLIGNDFEKLKCSACGVVVQELLLAIEKEVLRDGVTDKNGEVVLKLNWSVLDGVCDRMKVIPGNYFPLCLSFPPLPPNAVPPPQRSLSEVQANSRTFYLSTGIRSG